MPPPLLALMPVYFWCLVRPDLMTPAAAFAIGLLQDMLSGGPPGVWTLSFVVTYAVIERQRDAFAGLSGLAAVLGFATAALSPAPSPMSSSRSITGTCRRSRRSLANWR